MKTPTEYNFGQNELASKPFLDNQVISIEQNRSLIGTPNRKV